MDQKNLPLFIAISIAILLGSQYFFPHKNQAQLAQQAALTSHNTPSGQTPPPTHDPATPGTQPVHVPPPSADAPRLTIDAPRVLGSLSLQGARLDDLRLRDYHETIDPKSPLVRVLEPAADPQPSYVQFGWAASGDAKIPDDTTLWTASGTAVSTGHPVTLSWDNGAGLTFHIDLAVDDNYLFTIRQWVHNSGTTAVQLWPWERIHRDYLPQTAGYSVLFEGLIGVADNVLQQVTYAKAKSEGAKNNDIAYEHEGMGGWAGFTDKYWLTALVPDQAAPAKTSWVHTLDDNADRFQVDYVATTPEQLAPGAEVSSANRVFVGAKEVHLLDRYENTAKIPRPELRRRLGPPVLSDQTVFLHDRLDLQRYRQFRCRHPDLYAFRQTAVLSDRRAQLSLDGQDASARPENRRRARAFQG